MEENYFFYMGKLDTKKQIFQKVRNWGMRNKFANRNTENNYQAYNRKVECRTVKMIEKRIQNKPSNIRRVEGPLAIIRLNTRYEKKVS